MLQRTIGSLHRPDRVRSWIGIPPKDSMDPIRSKSYEASLAAVFIISAPFTMVKVSIVAFLTSLTIYQAFIWKHDLDINATSGDSRPVFIDFIIVTGMCIVFFPITFSAKNLETLWRTRTMERAVGEVHSRALTKVDTTVQSINMGALKETSVKTPELGRKAASLLSSHHKERGSPAEESPAIVQGQHKQIAQIVAGGVLPRNSIGSLRQCLDDAAQAHTQCAKADRQVALAYSRLSSTTRTNQTAHPSTQDFGRGQ